MSRTLPWLTAGGKVKREAISPTPAAGIKRSSTPRIKNEAADRNEPPTPRKDFLRSSPSPPSSPIQRCPSEDFLQEGLDKDDIYMMVEDEFYTVAQTFTRHLHYAEFVRLKREAKLQNAATIADISRPTDGTTPVSAELKKKTAAEELKRKQMEGIDAALGKQAEQSAQDEAGDELEVDDAWKGTHLGNLILSPRRVRSLVGLQGVRSSTRAAKGFAQSSSIAGSEQDTARGGRFLKDLVEEGRKDSPGPDDTTEDDDYDDLDAGAQSASPTVLRTKTCPAESRPGRQATSSSTRPAREEEKAVFSRPRTNHGLLKRSSLPANGRNQEVVGARQPVLATERNTAPSSLGASHRPSSTVRRTDEKRPSEELKKGQATEPEDVPFRNIQVKRRLVFDDFDELPEPPKASVQNERRRPLSTNSQHKKRKEDTRPKKSRLHEVPTFLI